MTHEAERALFDRTLAETSRVLIGQDALIRQVLVGLLARGHVLLEGVPGLGKTLLVRTLAQVLGLSFHRIQFTPDLMPSDITGGNIFNQKEGRFVFMPGPIFANLVLADEINRAPAKTQAALLEAMQEQSVTKDGTTRPLESPFLVLATQNPVESQGTYPLPEAQLDRFLFKIQVDYPSREIEEQLLRNHLAGFDATKLKEQNLQTTLTPNELLGMQRATRAIQVADELLPYITGIIEETRRHRAVYLGASPRGSIGLLAASRAWALTQGRNYVVPDDIKQLAPAVLRHRLVLHPDAELEGLTADTCIDEILRRVPAPQALKEPAQHDALD